MSKEERANEARRVEQVNVCVVRVNKRADERVAQYFYLASWFVQDHSVSFFLIYLSLNHLLNGIVLFLDATTHL